MLASALIPDFTRPWWWSIFPISIVFLLLLRKYMHLHSCVPKQSKANENPLGPLDNTGIIIKSPALSQWKPWILPLLFFFSIAFSMAGPVWSKKIVNTKSFAAIVVSSAPSQQNGQKVIFRKILRSLSPAPVGVILYAGSAHVLSPVTFDIEAVKMLYQAASSHIMPLKGERPEIAVEKAIQLFKQSRIAGGEIIWMSETISEESATLIRNLILKHNLSFYMIDTSDKIEEKTYTNLTRQNDEKYIHVKTHDMSKPLLPSGRHATGVDGSVYILPLLILCINLLSRKIASSSLLLVLLTFSWHPAQVRAAPDTINHKAEIQYNLGNRLAKAYRFEESINAYEQALKLSPDHKDAIHNRQMILNLLNAMPATNTKWTSAATQNDNEMLARFLRARFAKEQVRHPGKSAARQNRP